MKAADNELGQSIAAVAVAYVRDNRLNASALSGFSSVAQLEDSLKALDFKLTPEQVRFLETGK